MRRRRLWRLNIDTVPVGLGIGWRSEISGIVSELPGLAFCEVIAESIGEQAPDRLVALGVPVVTHGISLSMGGAEPVEQHRIDRLARVASMLGSPLVSEHIAFVRADGIEAGHLLPVPRTHEALTALARNIARTQDGVPVPLAVENIAALFDWPEDQLTESEFLAELVERTGVRLVLDIANVYANALNRGRDPWTELERLPLDRIAYCHIAGGTVRGGIYHDTHTAPVPDEVLELLRTFAMAGHRTPLMLERDGHYPPEAELLAELDAIADAAGLDRITGVRTSGYAR
ncbi:DUF692 domain-containing protein [Rhodococcoides fascians]|uniref:DUF692 domain-containing protein n=1 Tax=Rhodococcoides fascians TaxID=1828 RepID=UPI000651D9EF|nr:DUF692 domain-containing protein [Rhodococcus fascians]KMJ48809.1 endonuclease [Rhodococcus fascians]OZC38313.1 DUF692 domain-containing protein [Rhodococcus fascians]